MRVLFVHHCGTYGGSCRSLGMLLPYLQQQGVETHVLTPPGKSADYLRSIADHVTIGDPACFPLYMTVVGASGSRYNVLRNVVRKRNFSDLRRLVREIRPDVLHLNEWGLYPLADVGTQSGSKVVIHARTMPHKGYPALNRRLIRGVAQACDHLLCISGSVATAMTDVSHRSVLYNPVADAPSRVSRVESSQVRFLSLSAIQVSKGVFDIAEAATMLKGRSDIRIQIAGNLSVVPVDARTRRQRLFSAIGLMDFEVANRLKRQIEDNDLSNIDLLGHVSDVDAAVANTDVILAPMHLNAPPRSVYEGALHGIPSILSMEDKVHDIVEDGETGLLIDEQAPEQLANAIRYLADNPAACRNMGQAARERCLVRHNPVSLATQLYEVYQQVLNQQKACVAA